MPQPREHQVPCQAIGCRALTWRHDALCDRHVPDVHTGLLHAQQYGATVGLTCSCGERLSLGEDPTPERALAALQQHRAVAGAVA